MKTTIKDIHLSPEAIDAISFLQENNNEVIQTNVNDFTDLICEIVEKREDKVFDDDNFPRFLFALTDTIKFFKKFIKPKKLK